MPHGRNKGRNSEPKTSLGSEDCADCAVFQFSGAIPGKPRNPGIYACVSTQQQNDFQELFYEQIEAVKNWFKHSGWISAGEELLPLQISATYRPDKVFHVFVAEEYEFSRALVPAWLAQRGRMEFPASRVVVGEAAVAHELTHVFFPNSNRMLAEGLAIYLHQCVAPNAAFPNFKMDLHQLVAQLVEDQDDPFNDDKAFDKLSLADLDRVSTPDDLSFRLGQESCDDSSVTYALAGSFVQFLLEHCESTADHKSVRYPNFFKLYRQTPLVPMARDPGGPDRWQRIYERSLADLEAEWKKLIRGRLARANRKRKK